MIGGACQTLDSSVVRSICASLVVAAVVDERCGLLHVDRPASSPTVMRAMLTVVCNIPFAHFVTGRDEGFSLDAPLAYSSRKHLQSALPFSALSTRRAKDIRTRSARQLVVLRWSLHWRRNSLGHAGAAASARL